MYTMPRLSHLSRGTGEVKQETTRRVNVTLDPKDLPQVKNNYHRPQIFNPDTTFVTNPETSFIATAYMPPPGLYQPRPPRLKREATLPKTFSTKKGDLVLYSEEFARLHHSSDYERQQLDIRTTDLALAITRFEDTGVNKYRFGRDRTPEIKPGHSARRHVADWHFSHPEVNIRSSLGSRFSKKPDKHGRKKRIVKTSLTVFPPPYVLPRSLSQIKNGPPVKSLTPTVGTPQSIKPMVVHNNRSNTSLYDRGVSKILSPFEINTPRKEWTKPVTPRHDRDLENMSSASTDIKFTRNRLPPIFKHPSSRDGRSTHTSSSSSGSIRKKVRIQLDPIIVHCQNSPDCISSPE